MDAAWEEWGPTSGANASSRAAGAAPSRASAKVFLSRNLRPTAHLPCRTDSPVIDYTAALWARFSF